MKICLYENFKQIFNTQAHTTQTHITLHGFFFLLLAFFILEAKESVAVDLVVDRIGWNC